MLALVPIHSAMTAAHAAAKTKDQVAAERAVEVVLHSVIEGFRTRDAKLLSSSDIYFSDDSSEYHYVLFDVIPPFVDVGYKTLVDKNTRFIAAVEGPVTVSWTDKYIDGDGGFAYFRGVMHVHGVYKDGRKLEFALRHTLIFKKINGKYLIVHEHASVPDVAIGMESPQSKP